ncbi:MAG: hypothetical protein QMD36_01330 [Candidatus Aenigmarchaeota archaeon]|nr:hypothetical protein [Candidatus Aenigmarchaeota archaeon]
MKRKGDVENIQLVLLVAICVVGGLFIFYLMTQASSEACKMAQMDELNKIWGELRYWEDRKEVVSPVSFNTIPDFNVKPCVKGITYERTTYEDGKIVVEWTDGAKDIMPAKGKWDLCKPLPPGEYYARVSFKKVEILSGGKPFCVYCACREDNKECNEKCVGSVICGDLGVCWDGNFYSKSCFYHDECLEYCAAYCVNTTGSNAFTECSCANFKECEAVCGSEDIPDVIPGDKDA